MRSRYLFSLASTAVLVPITMIGPSLAHARPPHPRITVLESNEDRARAGYAVGSADVNGDGFDDVLVGAPTFSSGAFHVGQASVYSGSPSGPSHTPSWTSDGNHQADAMFGTSVTSAGDTNGDGYEDVVIGAPTHDGPHIDDGRAYLYLGSAQGLSATPAWIADGTQRDSGFGSSVAGAGDVNGDGFGDVVVGAPTFDNGIYREGRAYVYLGSAQGLSPTPVWITDSNQDFALLGTSVAGAGDVNGDVLVLAGRG